MESIGRMTRKVNVLLSVRVFIWWLRVNGVYGEYAREISKKHKVHRFLINKRTYDVLTQLTSQKYRVNRVSCLISDCTPDQYIVAPWELLASNTVSFVWAFSQQSYHFWEKVYRNQEIRDFKHEWKTEKYYCKL